MWMLLLWWISIIGAMSDDIKQAIKTHTVHGQKEFAIVVPTYNNSYNDICIKNISSVIDQRYDNYRIYIVDDCSTDDTVAKLKVFLADHARADKVTLIESKEHVGAVANYYAVIHQLEDHVIVLNVDGDDWLAHKKVLKKLNVAYNKDIWLTYGQFKVSPSNKRGFCKPINPEHVRIHQYRSSTWLTTHLRTYYAWLFKKIRYEDLCYQGSFMCACGDRAIMYPLVEMAAGRFLCMSDVLYVYNCANPLADIRINLKEQREMCNYIRALPVYQPLAEIIDN